MLFSYAMRSVYIESCSLFVRGGVYRVVKEAMGGSPRQAVGVGPALRLRPHRAHQQRLGRAISRGFFVEDIGRYLHHPLVFSEDHFSAVFAVLIVLYFWWKNIQGIHESSEKALQIMIITTVMVVVLIVWCAITVLRAPVQLPPNPLHPGVVPLTKESLRLAAWHLDQPSHLDHSVRRVRTFGPGDER